MRRSEAWVSGVVRQNNLRNIGRVPVVAMSGQSKRSAAPKKSKSELGTFKAGTSIVGGGELI